MVKLPVYLENVPTKYVLSIHLGPKRNFLLGTFFGAPDTSSGRLVY